MRADKLRVDDLMTTALITMKVGDTVSRADLEMRLAEVRHIPVIDDHQRVAGILSNRDIARVLAGGAHAVRVGEIMTRKVRTVKAGTAAAHAAELMLEHKIGALPVLGEGGELIGIITETDLLEVARRALLGLPIHER